MSLKNRRIRSAGSGDPPGMGGGAGDAKGSRAAVLLLLGVLAALWYGRSHGRLLLLNEKDGSCYAAFPAKEGDSFRIGFLHSVNKSPVIDCYELRHDGIYVVSTVYYGFGAGVQTELEEGQSLRYGEDGSMIVSGFHKRLENLIYFVGTVSDHTLELENGEKISLRELCGRSAELRLCYKPYLP